MTDITPNDSQQEIPALFTASSPIDKNIPIQLVEQSQKAQIKKLNNKFNVKLSSKTYEVLKHDDKTDTTEPYLVGTLEESSGNVLATDLEWRNLPLQSTSEDVLKSIEGKFIYKAETKDTKGLRTPQIGALHAISSTFTTSKKEPISIVLPTGTGKTDTMVSAFAAHRIPKLLVLVPSDALRVQISEAFENYGVLQKAGVLSEGVLFPVVGKLEHKFESKLAARGFADACNVVVAIPQALSQMDEDIQQEFTNQFTHLFIDEAHHTAAKTWNEIKDRFHDKRVVQFTATPFREDGKRIGGKIAYQYPLRDAQVNGYFSKINYISIVDFTDIDRAIAKRAVEALNEDITNGKDHILMARVNTKKRADELLDLYVELAEEHKPLVLHSGIAPKIRKKGLESLKNHDSKIVICVDMLGEGFDMPELKIAAMHDTHKSLGITLQFVGRFARVGGKNLGEATAVVGRGDRMVDHRLNDLYAEQSDWNKVINNLSEDAIQEQQDQNQFESEFTNVPDDINLWNITPKMSTVVYKAPSGEWHPERISELYKKDLYSPPSVNSNEKVAWFVTKRVGDVRWGDVKPLVETSYGFIMVYWNERDKLLFINSSENDGVYKSLAEAVGGENVSIYKGPEVYRSLAYLQRRVAINVGLKDIRNADSIFEMRVGRNVLGALDEETRRNKHQTNIFAHGIDEKSGKKISVGASLGGRVWTYKTAMSIKEWMEWADYIGNKLNDDTIDPNVVMDTFMNYDVLQERPEGYTVLALEWPTDIYLDTTDSLEIKINETVAHFSDVELMITEYNDRGDIKFKVSLPDGATAQYSLRMENGEMKFVATENQAFHVKSRSTLPLEETLNAIGLRIILEKEAIIEPSMVMLFPQTDAPAYPKSRLETADWSQTDITKEPISRGADSVQQKAFEIINADENWDIILNDDGSGEIADLVAIKVENDKIKVNLVHCKSSSVPTAGARITDLYELSGQAMKSIARRRNHQMMTDVLIKREKSRRKRGTTGLLKGDENKLVKIAEDSQLLIPEFIVTIVQPAISKAQISSQQLELIAATEKYIKESGGNTPLRVIINT